MQLQLGGHRFLKLPLVVMRFVLWFFTLARVALIPVFLPLGLAAQRVAASGGDAAQLRWAAVGTLVVMGLSDLIDGWIARRYHLATQVGAVVDAAADKLVQVTLVAFFTLSVGPVFTPLPFAFLVVIFGKDLILLVGVSVLRSRYGPIEVVHRGHGRTTSVMISMVLAWAAFGLPRGGLIPLVVATAGFALYSATLYSIDGIRQGRRARGPT
jgi:phosphatidylglycerophosphate synthase